MVQFLHCTIINLEPVLGKDFRTGLAFHGSTLLCHSYEPVRISGPRRRGPLIGQRFVVPHYSRPTPNQWPENLRSADLPTDKQGPHRASCAISGAAAGRVGRGVAAAQLKHSIDTDAGAAGESRRGASGNARRGNMDRRRGLRGLLWGFRRLSSQPAAPERARAGVFLIAALSRTGPL